MTITPIYFILTDQRTVKKRHISVHKNIKAVSLLFRLTHLGAAGGSAGSPVAAAPAGGSLAAGTPAAVDRPAREVHTAHLAVFEPGRAALARALPQETWRVGKAGYPVTRVTEDAEDLARYN